MLRPNEIRQRIFKYLYSTPQTSIMYYQKILKTIWEKRLNQLPLFDKYKYFYK